MYVLQVHVIQVRTHIQGAVIKSWSLLANVYRNTIQRDQIIVLICQQVCNVQKYWEKDIIKLFPAYNPTIALCPIPAIVNNY